MGQNRMKKAEHHKKEMIKANLFKHDSLIRNVETRKKVLEMKDREAEKKILKRNSLRKRKNLNLGLNEEMDGEEEEAVEAPKINPNANITTRRKHRNQLKIQRQKQKLIAEKKKRRRRKEGRKEGRTH